MARVVGATIRETLGGEPTGPPPAARRVTIAVTALVAITVSAGCAAEEPGAATRAGSDQVPGHVRVDVERTGGFGGLVTRRSADTDSLPAEEARQLTQLVGELDLDALRNAPSPTRTVPDAYVYDIVISADGTRVTLHAQDPGVPAELRPLIRFVVQRA